jgi:putative colanic acid biosynthesis acetyltransferase WcaF
MQRLDLYVTPSTWNRGAPFWVQLLWFCLGSPLVSANWLPGSFWRVIMLRLFGASLGRGCRVKPGFRVKFPWRLTIGDYCWLGEDVWIDNLAKVTLGDRVCVSQGAYLCTGNHDYRSADFSLRLGEISVGSDVWVAARSVLAPGTLLGNGCIVSLGSVVTGHIHPLSIVRGNPAQVIGTRSF